MKRGARDGPAADAVWTALNDPTRRAVVALLARGPRRAGDLAQSLSTTPPSLSRHLRILRTSGLVEVDDVDGDARVRVYQLRHEALTPLQHWLDDVGSFWEDQLAAFAKHAGASGRGPSRGRR